MFQHLGKKDLPEIARMLLNESVYSDKKFLKIISSLPPQERLPALKNRLTGDPVLFCVADKVKMTRCMELLTEEECFSVLFTTVGKKPLFLFELYAAASNNDHGHQQPRNVPFKTWYHQISIRDKKCNTRFIHDLMMILSFLQYEYKQYQASTDFLSQLFRRSEAGHLLSQLKQCQTVGDCKQALLTYLEQPDTMYGKKIVSCLVDDRRLVTLDDSIKAIAKEWNTVRIQYWLGESPEMV